VVDYSFQNAQVDIDPQTYLSWAAGFGEFARQSHFIVRINKNAEADRDLEAMMYLCENAELPGRALQTVDARTYGPNYKVPFQSAYPDITLTFVCTGGMYEKEFFDSWMEQINPISNFDFSYRDEYMATIDIFQYSTEATSESSVLPTYQLSLMEAYPVTIMPLPLNWAEDGFHRLSVQFVYTYSMRPYDQLSSNTYITPTSRTGGKKFFPPPSFTTSPRR
jgi:hypothetical protein